MGFKIKQPLIWEMITTCVAPLENTSMLLKECNENDAAERVEVLDPDRKIFHLLFERLPSLSIMGAQLMASLNSSIW